ncbi:MAG: PTS sugar transporter subunit IIA [Planctomycetes bacterium]|nr:PTS sugar transporter subunit IIA [Planctomycetota bacterium]
MNLDAIVAERQGIERLAGSTREQVFGEVAAALARSGATDPEFSDAVAASYLQREKRGTTAFGFGVALPHVFHPSLRRIHMLVARHPSGVDFGALDGDRTRILICLAGPESLRDEYLKLLAFLAGAIRNQTWRKLILTAQDTNAIYDALAEAAAEG